MSINAPERRPSDRLASVSSLTPERIRVEDVSKLVERAGVATEYIVDQVIAQDANNGIVGPPTAGKSPHVHGILRSAWTGEPWLGHEVHKTCRRIGYMTGEGEKPHGRALIKYGLWDAIQQEPGVYLPYLRERNFGLGWAEAVDGMSDLLLEGAAPGEPIILVVELITDHADFGKDGENDSDTATRVYDVVKMARDRGITPLIQLQTPKGINDVRDEDITLEIIRGSGGAGGHFDILHGIKLPSDKSLRKDTRFWKTLRNRLDGVLERDHFYIQQLPGGFISHEQAPKPDIQTEVLRAIDIGELDAVNKAEMFNMAEIRSNVGRNMTVVKETVEKLQAEGVIDSAKVATGKRGPQKVVYFRSKGSG